MIIKKLKKILEKKTLECNPIYSIYNTMLRKQTFIENEKRTTDGVYYKTEYYFNQPMNLDFFLLRNSEEELKHFENVMQFTVIELMNVFIDCRIKYYDGMEPEKFFILNDVFKLGFEIYPTKEVTINDRIS